MEVIHFTLKKDNQLEINEDIQAEWQNDSLRFIHNNMIHIIDSKNETFQRENEEYSFLLDCKNKKCEIHLKSEDYLLQVKVEYAILLRNQKNIQISYRIETEDKDFVVEIN